LLIKKLIEVVKTDKILSICIPVYNGGELAYKHVKEILTYKNNDIEIVVSDNASTDNTVELIMSIRDERLKIITHEKNIGPFRNWYEVLMAGKAKYVMLHQDNDKLVVKNIPKYINFLKSVQYDIIRNTSGIYKGESGELTVPQVQFYNYFYSHAGNIVYLREALHSIEPLKCSFDSQYTSYPYCIWDTQILKKYSLNIRKAYLNGNITIKYSPNTYFDRPSRTKSFVAEKYPAYSYDNIIRKFVKHIRILRYLYPNDNEYIKMFINAYKAYLYLATINFYVIMETPGGKGTKKRYGLEILDNKEIDYIGLNNDFFDYTLSKLNFCSPLYKLIACIGMKIITIYNKNVMVLSYYQKKLSYTKKIKLEMLNKFLKNIIEKMCE
jgi:glycosyltransferase involved in cell wall biosynthesis